MPVKRTLKRVGWECLMIATLCLTHSVAHAEKDLSNLTVDQLIDQYHRAAYREELNRRKAGYTKAERDAIRAKLMDPTTKRRFPVQYAEDELFACAVDYWEDANTGHRALVELRKRYRGATSEELAAFTERLRKAYRATPYPDLLPDTSNQTEYSANRGVYSALDNTVKNVLPEAEAVALFREIYLESGQRGAASDFMLRLQGEPFQGPPTQAVLEELQERYKNMDQESLRRAGELDELNAVIGQKLRRFADNGIDALKAREWHRNPLDIILLGQSENPEARELLVSHYGTLSKEWLATESRLDILRALVESYHRKPDVELQRLLREQLTAIAEMDHNANLHYLERTAEVIAETDDPYYIPVLEKCRAGISQAAVRAASAVPDDVREDDIKATLTALDNAVKALELAQLRQP